MISTMPLPQIEFIEMSPTEHSPEISKVQIKVLYVQDTPNRNKTVFTKEIARDMAHTLRGAPIVGYYNAVEKDFEEHNQEIVYGKDGIDFKDNTFPYGFVDINAKVWFQKFYEQGIEREYMMTEGYIWNDAFPEANRILEKGNNQSMQAKLKGNWSKDDYGNCQFFIVNEGIISKLCILGEEYEPCFEGAQIKSNFSLSDETVNKFYSMAKQLKEIFTEGGNIEMEENKVEEIVETEVVEETPAPVEEEAAPAEELSEKNSENFGQNETNENTEILENNEENNIVEESETVETAEPVVETVPATEYNTLKEKCETLETENTNYIEQVNALTAKVEELTNSYNSLKESTETELATLREFKLTAERAEKKNLIDSFYMLSEEDKKPYIENIDTYSLHDIKSGLAIICFDNKVNFSLNETEESNNMTFSIGTVDEADDAPDWIKAVRETKKNNID